MAQPIPKKIIDSKPSLASKTFNTMLIDGSNLLEVCFRANKKLSSNGKEIGGIFEFLLQIKLLLRKANFRYVYVFWDGDNSGQLRYNLYSEYKANRDKSFEDTHISEYMKEVNERVKNMTKYFSKRSTKVKDEKEKEVFHWQRSVLIDCLEELFIRQCLCDKIEADDFIGYYVTHKKPNERIVIVSNDRDLTQLISEDVIIYVQSLHKFINTKNHKEEFGYCYENVLLKKILCGDTSDNIKGIKGLGEKTLFDKIDGFKDRRMTLQEVINKAKEINEERLKTKKKPLQWAENIVNRVTDGIQGKEIYNINKSIIDLRNPLMTQEAKELIESIMYSPIDAEGRTMTNLYNILLTNHIDDLKDETTFANFFADFQYLIDKEKKNL